MPLPNEERRPMQEAASGVIVADGDTHRILARCHDCGHLLWANRSVLAGIGPVCRRRRLAVVA